MSQVWGFDWVMSKGVIVSFQVIVEVVSLVQGPVSLLHSPLSSFESVSLNSLHYVSIRSWEHVFMCTKGFIAFPIEFVPLQDVYPISSNSLQNLLDFRND